MPHYKVLVVLEFVPEDILAALTVSSPSVPQARRSIAGQPVEDDPYKGGQEEGFS